VRKKMTHADLLADELDRALQGQPWHGASLKDLVDGISFEQAIQRPIPSAHNIWELVLHITSWANIALRRLTGGQTAPYPDEDWPVIGEMNLPRWEAAKVALKESHEKLREAVLALNDDRLAASAPESENSVAVMLHGVSQHAAYHGGQIALLKKAVVTQHRRAAL
jgi:uncharacterized damage-inducible protein DinB